MKTIKKYLFIICATMMAFTANVCTASAQTNGTSSGTVRVQANNTVWSRSVTFKQMPGYYKKYKKSYSLKNGVTRKYMGTYKYYNKFSYNGSGYTSGSKTIYLSKNEYKQIRVKASVANVLSLIPNNSAAYEYENVSSPYWYVSKTTRCSAW